MPLNINLPNIEQTIIELAVELLLIEREKRYPDLLFGRTDNKTSPRISMHYVLALLAYGLQPDEPELKEAVDWFDLSFPRIRDDIIDVDEMNRLLVLLHTRPERDTVHPRLEQLVRQQAAGYFDIQPGWQAYDTLWALEALITAKEAGVLTDDLMSLDQLQQHLNTILSRHEMKRDKDMALALNLQYRLNGKLEPTHIELLDGTLEFAEQNEGLWGMREFAWRMNKLKSYQALSEGRRLTYEMVRDHYEYFRKVIISTCMVVEYLSPLATDYPQLCAPLEKAMGIWWRQFNGANAPTILRMLFPAPHNYQHLLVLSRTLRAVRAYVGKPLRSLDAVHLLREMTRLKTDRTEPEESRNLKLALRNWLKVDLIGGVEQLRLGFSEAHVVRVEPKIYSPLSGEDQEPITLPTRSLVIKYGPQEDIEKERISYNAMPPAVREYYVRIPESSYNEPGKAIAYVVMQDLRDYRTLYEVYIAVAKRATEIGDLLGNFLTRMHEGGTSQTRPVPRNLLRETYLARMIEYIDRVFDFLRDHQHTLGCDYPPTLQYELFEMIAEIIKKQRLLEKFPAAYMHGDLHMRNIMVRGLEDTNGRSGVSFRLIDLEFFQTEGDAAFDAGQLLIDIDLVSREEEKLDYQKELLRLRDSLVRSYQKFNALRDDETFSTRVELAKARALLRIAKGKTKRGRNHIDASQIGLAQQLATDIIANTIEARNYLQTVVGALT